ncbi:GTPase ObgE [Candidatus Kaiserbacteria bacterium]|nr:GTPase ObgE [Candidatus Kaiserbacteria bacterium]MCB9812606.1 GTPase ObgE [Candidatus Nomurabacteria bacterium]
MFVDELTIYAKAGDGGDGVVRWRHEKFKPLAGPAGGNGGNGGDVYVRAVKDLNRLSKYTGNNHFYAENGEAGTNQSKAGRNGEDLYIDVPVGSRITDTERHRTFELTTVGAVERILKGGSGGLGNEYFKSSVNRAPEQATKGRAGEAGNIAVEVSLMVDVGLVGFPNAGKSTLLNQLTNAKSRIGAYPFTTVEPHLGDLYGFVIADIPGLITGAAAGKGLGHKFLRHISRTKMLLHLVSLDHEDPVSQYYTIREELSQYSKTLNDKEEWIILTKKDLVEKGFTDTVAEELAKTENRVLVIGQDDPESYKTLQDSLVSHLRDTYNT